jgi:hypothetical protein
MKSLSRGEFLNNLIRYLLFGFLALVAAIIGNRVVAGSDCSSCPGKGICAGESDCSTYLSD